MISQREARRYKKRVEQLERILCKQRSFYAQEYVGGIEVAYVTLQPTDAMAIRTARKLGHAVVVIGRDDNAVKFFALPHPKDNL